MSFPRLITVILLLVIAALPLTAQTTGSLSGAVTDASGGAVPGVTVEAKSSALQGVRTTVTDREGLYRIPLLPPGEYALTYKLEGFAPEMRRGITISLGKETSIDVKLKPSASQEITVTAEAPVLDTSSTASTRRAPKMGSRVRS